MLENIIKGRSFAFKISLKCAVSILMIVLAVSLPQLAHIIGGTAAGAVYLPMYARNKSCFYFRSSRQRHARG